MTKKIFNGLTPVESRMMLVLEDGGPHEPTELHKCLEDDLGALTNIWTHLTTIRNKINPHGYDISYRRTNGKTAYRLVRLISQDR